MRNVGGTFAVLTAQVVRKEALCRDHFVIGLLGATLPPSEPGQFVQVTCASELEGAVGEFEWTQGTLPRLCGSDWQGRRPLLRRPFSLADRWDDAEGTHLTLIVRAVGPGTRYLASLPTGATLDLIGPLGRGFKLPPVQEAVVLIGGGVGVPPLLYLARRLNELGWKDVTAIFGAGSADTLPLRLKQRPSSDGIPTPCVEWPSGAQFDSIITTEDGSAGLRGLVTDGLIRWHTHRTADRRRGIVFACGPDAMLKAVSRLTRELGLECQLCVERLMGCGLGTCLSCVIRQRDPNHPKGWRWALTCTEGPVFNRDELIDYVGSSAP